MNINTIAELAGVSRATVSRYLNDGYVSQHNRNAIARVIEQTGYVPSSQAQNLRTGRTGFVGAVIPKISSESVGRMVAGISDVLLRSGYQLLLANTDNDISAEVSYLRALSENRVDGLILLGTVITEGHLEAIAELRVPLVILGQEVHGQSCVVREDLEGARELTQHILKTAHRPAFIGVDDADRAAGLARREGFVRATTQAGIPTEGLVIELGGFSAASGRDCCERIMRAHPQTDAIVCATDTIAAGAMAWLHENDYDIPGDVQVAGVGDSVLSQVSFPRLTTVHHFYRSSGAEAARLLVDAMGAGEGPTRLVRMGHELVLRDSTR